MYRSNMKFLYIFYLILMITPEIRTDNEVKIIAIHKDPICESLKNNNSTQFNIVAIGTTSKRLLLITKNYYVYDVPINSLDLVHDKLHLPTKPTPIRDKYPILFNSQGFRLILSARLNLDAYIINDGKNDWVFFGERLKVHYNIDTSEVFTKLVPYDKKNKVFVSSDMPRHYYSLVRVNNNLFMSIDRYDDDSDFSNMSTIQTEGAKYSICSNPQNTRIRMEKGKCRSGIPVQWPVLKGFASDGKFYLFSQKYIFILDEDVYNNQGEEYPVQKISFDSFFNCAGIIPASNVITKSCKFLLDNGGNNIVTVVPRGRRRMRSSFVNGKTGGSRRRMRSSFVNGKTGGSGFEEGRSKFKLTKMSTNIATTRSGKSMAQQISRPVMVSSRGNHRSLTGGSAHVTAHTGIDHDNNGYANTTNPNLLKRSATRIPSNERVTYVPISLSSRKMALPSNLIFPYIFNLVLMIISEIRTDNKMTTTATQKDHICERLQHNNGTQFQIMAIGTTSKTILIQQIALLSYVVAMGRTKKRVLLITKDLYVYDAPVDSFDSNRNKTYFKYLPTPMKDKYPVLYDNPLFKSIKNDMNVGIMYDSDGDWICMTTNNGKQGINYNIDTSKVHKGFVLSGEGPETLIATNEPCKSYSIQRREANENDLSLTALWLTAYKCKNGDRIINSDGIEKVTDFRLLCYDKKYVDILMIEGKKCDSDDDSRMANRDRENVFTQKGKQFYVTRIDNKNFFKCDDFYWIIAAMVLLVIIISGVYVAHRSLANRKKTRSGLERSSKISLSKSSIKVASKRSLKSKSKIEHHYLRRSRKATSPGSRTSLSGRSRKATSPGSRTSLKGRSARPTSPMSKMSSKISLNRLKRSKSRLNSISRGGSTSKLAKRILLITKDYYVYDVPINYLDHDKLYLPTKPTPIQDKYPILFKNQIFADIRTMKYKLHYNIDTSEVFGESVPSDKKNEVFVSSDKPRHYYSLVIKDNNLYMNIDRYDDDDSDFKNMSIIPTEGSKYLICSNPQNTKIRMEKEIKCRSGIPVQWPILKGFVTNNKFYLFGHSCIYIFDEAVYNNQGEKYPVKKISYDTYFLCQDEKIQTEKNREQRKQMDIIQYVYLVIMIVLFILSLSTTYVILNKWIQDDREAKRLIIKKSNKQTGSKRIISKQSYIDPSVLKQASIFPSTMKHASSSIPSAKSSIIEPVKKQVSISMSSAVMKKTLKKSELSKNWTKKMKMSKMKMHSHLIMVKYCINYQAISIKSSLFCIKLYAVPINNLHINIDRYDEVSDFSNMSIIPSVVGDYSICYNPLNTRIRMEKGKCRSGIPVQWPVLKGFASDGKFYLFGHSYIYIFDEDAYNNQGKEYPVHKISYDSYFICQDEKIPTEKNREQRKQI
ncbi:hypothetical protein DERP_003837, partial [Dermatophagoides pteronyssinus]